MVAIVEDRGSGVADPGGWSSVWDPPGLCDDTGEWLADRGRRLGAAEAVWLSTLAGFDTDRGWEVDGQVSCVDWLMWRAGLARTTAFEKLRVAHALTARPVLAAALAEGRVSYCAVRVMVRAVGADPAVDEAFVAVAEAGTVTDVERAVRTYLLHASQEQPPDDQARRRGVRMVPRGDGTTRVEAILTDDEAAELDVAIDAHLRQAAEAPPSGSAEYARADDRERTDPDARDWMARRADALVELAGAGLAGGHTPGADRYVVHLVVTHGPDGRHHGSLLGGQPLPDTTTARILCDCATVVHRVDADGTSLNVGRKTREWTTAQRRAITVRDGGHCRWPGCRRTYVDVHHVHFWERGGPTDVDNGIALCRHHHRALHTSFRVTGCANRELTFWRADGTFVGSSAVRAGL